MAYLTYAQQLKHPQWQRKRLECLSASGFACSSCGAEDSTLHVHHRRYVRGRMAWEYSTDELSVLCENCHSVEHKTADTLSALVAEDQVGARAGLALLAGYAVGSGFCADSIGEEGHEADAELYELGLLVSCIRFNFKTFLKIIEDGNPALTPPQLAAVARWREFSGSNGGSDGK